MALSAAPMSVFAAFGDVGTSTQYGTAIEALQSKGVIGGYADGTFKPKAEINRAELLKILLEARTDGKEIAGSNCFPDVKDEWFAKYVCTAKNEGIVSGYPDGFFKPEQPVNFVEASKIFSLAYKQNPQAYSADWFEPFVRALEGSKAIPTSVAGLDKPLVRGEMAEIMWRLSEQKTDQPSKGYINVKYPEVKVNLASDAPQTAKSCADLGAFAEEAKRTGGRYGGGFGGEVMLRESMDSAAGAPVPPAVPQSTKTTNSVDESYGADGDYSQTNVQVAGVDEGDIVKTDGTYVYVVSQNRVRIIQAVPGSAIKQVSEIVDTKSDDTHFGPQEVYVDGTRLVVIGSSWKDMPYHIMERSNKMMIYPPIYYNPPRAEVRIYDITDKTKPTQQRVVAFDGHSVSHRLIQDKLYFVVNQPVRWDAPMPLKATAEDLLPKMEDSRAGVKPVANCDDVIILPRVPSPQYLTVGVIDIDTPTAEVKRETVLGSAQNVYASLKNLYVATTEWIYHWDAVNPGGNEKTNLYRFEFTPEGVAMKAQGSVPGHLLNQFSMDEHENTFRVATTQGNNWMRDNAMSNNLFVLNQAMETVGSIEDIAPGEQIYSTRFMGDRAYMVTFKTTDPLFVIDTSDPRNPRILGKLKIPGYSNYLHPYDENHLIGFGKEATESKDGNFAWYQGMKIAIFDVSNVNDPKELHNTVIGDRGTDSPLLWNHKALLFEKDKNLLVFPVTVHKISDEQKQAAGSEPASAYGSPVFQGAYVYDLTLKDGFTQRGTITHYAPDTFQKAGDFWYDYGKDIQRVVRLGNSLVSISDRVIQSTGLQNLKKEGSVEFPIEQENPVYYEKMMDSGGATPPPATTAPAPATR